MNRTAAWLFLGSFSVPTFAQQATPAIVNPAPADGVVSYHIVRSGDTLNDITALYQGSRHFVPENRRLNPQIKNPDLIHPGHRLRLRLTPEAAKASVARLDDLSRRVEELPLPESWMSAVEGDLLLAGDGLRTHDNASARLRFGDGTNVVATENAVLFVRPARERAPGMGPTAGEGALEMVRGRADLELRPADALGESRFEVVMGTVKATASAQGPQVGKSRVRQEEKAGSKLMMYGGKASVAAAGKTVEVPEGSGTSVPAGEPPRPPETLLLAPELGEPAPGARLAYANPGFAWTPIAKAAGYQFELCADEACGRILAVHRGIDRPTWRPTALAMGTYFWRVSAISASGLDGFPSLARAVEISGESLDADSPQLRVEPSQRSATFDGVLCVGEREALNVQATDSGSGVESILASQDGGTEAPISGPRVELEDGQHVVRVVAIDRVGNRTISEPLRLTVDSEAPEIAWSVTSAPSAKGVKGRRWGDLLHLDWSRATAWWAPWQRHGRRGGAGEMSLPFSWIEDENGGSSQLKLVALRDSPLQVGGPQLRKGEALVLDFRDAGCGLDKVSVAAADAGRSLEIQVADRLGNSRTVRWPVAPR